LAAFERWLDAAIEAGPDLVQVRERDLEARALAGLTRRAVARAAGSGVRILVNDRADVAHAAAAAGVHLRADGPPASRVRSLSPIRWFITRSVHTLDEVSAQQDADALLFGTVFATRSKPEGSPVAGLEGLQAAAGASRVPVLAIGGVDAAGAASAVRAGAAGVAAIGVFLPRGADRSALGPARAVAALRAAMLEYPSIDGQ
jgi:thiamine-phosphate pyrophosphorylase